MFWASELPCQASKSLPIFRWPTAGAAVGQQECVPVTPI